MTAKLIFHSQAHNETAAQNRFFFGEDAVCRTFFCRSCAVPLSVRTLFLRMPLRLKSFFSSRTRFFFDTRRQFPCSPPGRSDGGIAGGMEGRQGNMAPRGLIYKRYRGPKSGFFEKNDKKSSKMFARFEFMPTFASAITKTVLLSLETNVAKVSTGAGSKSNFEKSFRKSS